MRPRARLLRLTYNREETVNPTSNPESTVRRVLFVCVENSNRSQIAEAFARCHGKEKIEAFSAGSHPSGIINPKAIQSMAELGYNLQTHHSKSLEEIPSVEFDAVVTMGCGDACPWIRAKLREDWNILDPKSVPAKSYPVIRDLIENKVKALLTKL